MTEDKLTGLGWRPFSAAQLDAADGGLVPARVLAVHRGRAEILGKDLTSSVPLSGKAADMGVTVGDWLLVDPSGPSVARRLDHFGRFRRRAAGTAGEIQSIAANVDTLFIVTSANRDFNIARLERYIAVAFEADITPVIVLTKADLTSTPRDYVDPAQAISDLVPVVTLDARDTTQIVEVDREHGIFPWDPYQNIDSESVYFYAADPARGVVIGYVGG